MFVKELPVSQQRLLQRSMCQALKDEGKPCTRAIVKQRLSSDFDPFDLFDQFIEAQRAEERDKQVAELTRWSQITSH